MNRKIELVPYNQGEKCSLYTFRYLDEDISEFDKFFDNYDTEEHKKDFDKLVYWLEKIGKEGIHERFFRPEIGGLKALPIDSKFRLYCFILNPSILILGNGGIKKTKTFNEDPILNSHAKNIESIGSILKSQLKKDKIQEYNGILYNLKPISFKSI